MIYDKEKQKILSIGIRGYLALLNILAWKKISKQFKLFTANRVIVSALVCIFKIHLSVQIDR